jgi:hypothetical protein
MTSFPMLNENYLQAGKAGVGWVQNTNTMQMAEENVEWTYIPPFSATGHEFTRAVGLANNGWISVAATADDPQKAVDVLEFLNSLEGRQLMVAGVQGLHYNTFDADFNFDRDEEVWNASYETQTFPLYFYVGAGLMHGYVPIENYDTFAEALANVVVFEPMPTSTGYRELIQRSSEWVGETNPFQFVEFPELADLRTELLDVIITGWTKLISAEPGQFEAEWDAFLSEWDRVGGADWVAAYQTYYNESMAN